MSNPALARLDEDLDRFYVFGDPPESYWSATTIIGGGVPKYLHAHYAKLAAELAYDALLERGPHSRAIAIANRLAARGRANVEERQARGELVSIKLHKLSPRDLALRWIKGAAERHRDAAGEVGSAVHQEAEELVLAHAREASRLYLAGVQMPDWPAPIASRMASFVQFLEDWHPIFVATEATVFNRTQAYAGTLDAIMELRAGDLIAAIMRAGDVVPAWLAALDSESLVRVIVDYKGGRAIYAEVAMQLAAYARSEFIGLPDRVTRAPLPAVQAGAVLHLTPTGYSFRLVSIEDHVFEAFKYAREIFRWRKETAKTVLLERLTPPPVEEVA